MTTLFKQSETTMEELKVLVTEKNHIKSVSITIGMIIIKLGMTKSYSSVKE